MATESQGCTCTLAWTFHPFLQLDYPSLLCATAPAWDTFLGLLAVQKLLRVDAAAPLSLTPAAVRMWLQASAQSKSSNRPPGSLD